MYNIRLLQWVKWGEKGWLFQKQITMPFVPSPGMNIVNLDGTGEELPIKAVDWLPRENICEVMLHDDEWDSANKSPLKEYQQYGWECLEDGIKGIYPP